MDAIVILQCASCSLFEYAMDEVLLEMEDENQGEQVGTSLKKIFNAF